MKAYFFTNMYVSGIHAGIQAGHAIDQMWLKYTSSPFDFNNPQFNTLKHFSKNHKTFILLNAGDHKRLDDMAYDLGVNGATYPYPWSVWRELGLNHTITSICVIVPDVEDFTKLPTNVYGFWKKYDIANMKLAS